MQFDQHEKLALGFLWPLNTSITPYLDMLKHKKQNYGYFVQKITKNSFKEISKPQEKVGLFLAYKKALVAAKVVD